MNIFYLPSEDRLLVRFCSVKGKPTKEVGRFKLWWDKQGVICALNIDQFSEEQKEFEKLIKK